MPLKAVVHPASIKVPAQVDLVIHPPPFLVVHLVKYFAHSSSVVNVKGAVRQLLIVQYP